MSMAKETLDELVDAYLAYLRAGRGMSENTQKTYGTSLARFVAAVGDDGIADVRTVSGQHIRSFIASERMAGRAATSVNNALSAVKGLFAWLAQRGVIQNNPAKAVPCLKTPKRLPSLFTAKELDMALSQDKKEGLTADPELDAFLSSRDSAIIELLYSSGLRVSELTGLDLGRYYPDERIVRVMGKGSKERLVPVGEPAAEAIKKYLQHRAKYASPFEQAMFVNRFGGRTTPANVYERLKILAKTRGLQGAMHPHKLRHTFATEMLKGSGDVRLVQELLGHSKLSTTQIYAHADAELIAAEYARAFPRDRMPGAVHDEQKSLMAGAKESQGNEE